MIILIDNNVMVMDDEKECLPPHTICRTHTETDLPSALVGCFLSPFHVGISQVVNWEKKLHL